MTQQQAKTIQELAKQYRPLSDAHFDKYTERLSRIKNFYDSKALDAELAQGYLFMGFVFALSFALEQLTDYRQLLIDLDKLAKEGKK
jgi:hypothetical protein